MNTVAPKMREVDNHISAFYRKEGQNDDDSTVEGNFKLLPLKNLEINVKAM
jgi:hypothetical protein